MEIPTIAKQIRTLAKEGARIERQNKRGIAVEQRRTSCPERNAMTEQSAPVTIVHHAAIDIAASADAAWQAILDDYVDARKFRETGYAIEPIDDPAAPLGGYRIRIEQDGVVVDERICHITERDDAARRLSMFADYLSIPGGMQVYATYHAQDAEAGSRYALDCHSSLPTSLFVSDAETEIGAAVAGMTAQAEAGLIHYLEGVKTRLEARN